MQQILWIETVLKLGSGLLLISFPMAAIAVLGLPRSENAFWPRLCGSIFIGLAAAAFIEGRFGDARGLGMAGCVAVNLSIAGILASQLTLGRSAPSRRGRLILWFAVAALVLLSLVEIAHF